MLRSTWLDTGSNGWNEFTCYSGGSDFTPPIYHRLFPPSTGNGHQAIESRSGGIAGTLYLAKGGAKKHPPMDADPGHVHQETVHQKV